MQPEVVIQKRHKKWEPDRSQEARHRSILKYHAEKKQRLLRESGYDSLPDGHKQCLRCRRVKPTGEFYKRKPSSKGKSPFRSWCKECDNSSSRDFRKTADSKRYHKNHHLVRAFGITIEQYEEILDRQSGCCAICGKTKADDSLKADLAVDHCHKTGKVRGLLCRHCNVALGKFGDDAEMLKKAINYLVTHSGDDR